MCDAQPWVEETFIIPQDADKLFMYASSEGTEQLRFTISRMNKKILQHTNVILWSANVFVRPTSYLSFFDLQKEKRTVTPAVARGSYRCLLMCYVITL